MKNWRMHQALRCCVWRGRRLTVSRLAAALKINRPHLTDVLNNTPGHGGQTRPKVARWLVKHFPEQAPAVLGQLGWDERGNQKVEIGKAESGNGNPTPAPSHENHSHG